MKSLILLLALVTCLPLAAQGAAQHPLDALDGAEITATTAILKNAGHLDDKTLVASISLHEPPKADVLAWQSGDAIPRSERPALGAEQEPFEVALWKAVHSGYSYGPLAMEQRAEQPVQPTSCSATPGSSRRRLSKPDSRPRW